MRKIDLNDKTGINIQTHNITMNSGINHYTTDWANSMIIPSNTKYVSFFMKGVPSNIRTTVSIIFVI